MNLAAMSHATLLASFETFANWCDGGSCTHQLGVQAMISTADHANFNSAMLKTVAASPEALRMSLEVLDHSGYPYSALAPAHVEGSLASVLDEFNLKMTESIPLMTATEPSGIEWPSELEISAGAKDFDQHKNLLVDVFELDRTLVDAFVSPQLWTDDSTRTIVGLADGVPVTTALSVSTGKGLAVFNVATHEDHRGKGYGAAATAAVTDPWFDEGVSFATLQSSPMGVSVYDRLGFHTVLEQERWV